MTPKNDTAPGHGPIPEPLYSCHHCREQYSWPARDIHWWSNVGAWVCNECWNREHGEKGICLADAIDNAQSVESGTAKARIAALEKELDFARAFCMCAYCKTTLPKDSEKVVAHMVECPKHPLGEAMQMALTMEAERDAANARVLEAEAQVARMREVIRKVSIAVPRVTFTTTHPSGHDAWIHDLLIPALEESTAPALIAALEKAWKEGFHSDSCDGATGAWLASPTYAAMQSGKEGK